MGVSSIVAIIALIGVSVTLASMIGFILGTFGFGEPIEVSLSLKKEIDRHGENVLIVTHDGGDAIMEAFELNDGSIEWRDIVVRKNGLKVTVTEGATMNGRDNLGLIRFDTDDSLRFPLKLESGDWIAIIYRPSSQMIIRTQV